MRQGRPPPRVTTARRAANPCRLCVKKDEVGGESERERERDTRATETRNEEGSRRTSGNDVSVCELGEYVCVRERERLQHCEPKPGPSREGRDEARRGPERKGWREYGRCAPCHRRPRDPGTPRHGEAHRRTGPGVSVTTWVPGQLQPHLSAHRCSLAREPSMGGCRRRSQCPVE